MEANTTFRVAPFGLSERELRVLNTICIVSRSRLRTYELCGAEPTADIAIVNGDDPEAVATWQVFHAGKPLINAIMLANQPVPDWRGHQIGRPIMSTRLLALLDSLEQRGARPTRNKRRESIEAAVAAALPPGRP